MVPDACTVHELPLAHAHTLPREGTVNPVPPATLVSLQSARSSTPGYRDMYPHKWGKGLREGETDAKLFAPILGGLKIREA